MLIIFLHYVHLFINLPFPYILISSNWFPIILSIHFKWLRQRLLHVGSVSSIYTKSTHSMHNIQSDQFMQIDGYYKCFVRLNPTKYFDFRPKRFIMNMISLNISHFFYYFIFMLFLYWLMVWSLSIFYINFNWTNIMIRVWL